MLFNRTIVRPGLAFLMEHLLDPRLASPEAEVMLMAIAMQESNANHRRQTPTGPARGFWQFERGGGFRGVREHNRTGPRLKSFCAEASIPIEETAQWEMLPGSELLQVAFARLLLWSDNAPLPARGRKEDAWSFYLRNWRPGKPHRDRWESAYQTAIDVTAANVRPAQTNLAALDAVAQIERLAGSLRLALRSDTA